MDLVCCKAWNFTASKVLHRQLVVTQQTRELDSPDWPIHKYYICSLAQLVCNFTYFSNIFRSRSVLLQWHVAFLHLFGKYEIWFKHLYVDGNFHCLSVCRLNDSSYCRAVGRSENPGVPVVIRWAQSGWNRVNWSAKIWVCHGTPGTPRDDTPA